MKIIWRMISTKKGLYFYSGTHLMRWRKGKLYVFPESLKIATILYHTKRNLFAYCTNGTIKIIDGKTVKPVYDGSVLRHQLLKGAYYLKDGRLALITVKNNYILKDSKISRWVTGAQNILDHSLVYNTRQLANGNIALATSSGLIILSPSGKLLHHINKKPAFRLISFITFSRVKKETCGYQWTPAWLF